METANNGNTDADVSDQIDSKRKSYPVRELRYVIEFVTKIYTGLGANLYHTRENIAKTNDLEVTSIKQIVSTCQQYGLLELKHKQGYKVTPLFIKIFKPLNDSEKRSAIIESIKSVDVFDKLINDFNGHAVPSLSGLTNNVERTFNLKEGIAQKVAELFITNIKEYGLVNNQNILDVGVIKSHDKQKEGELIDPPPPPPITEEVVITIPLRSSLNKIAHLHLPVGYTDSDLKRIVKFVNALKDEEEDEKLSP